MIPLNNEENGLGKNYWMAMVLSMVILLGYPYLMKKFVPQKAAAPEVVSTESADLSTSSLADQSLSKADGPFLEPQKEATVVQFKNEFYDLDLSTFGGTISRMEYIGEEAASGIPTIPFYHVKEKTDNLFGLKFLNEDGDLSKTEFRLNRKENNLFEFLFEKPGEYKITKQYRFDETLPIIHLQVFVQNLSDREKNFPMELDYGLHYEIDNPQKERSLEAVVQTSERLVTMNHRKIAKKGFYTSGGLEWAGIIKRYFAVLVKPNWPAVSSQSSSDEETIFSRITMEPIALAPGAETAKEFFIYAGPQRYEILKKIDVGFEHVLSRGIFGIFKIWLLKALKFLNRFSHNFGLAIIILTLGLKGVFAPLTHMSFENMKKMQALQPKLKSLQERYKKEPEKLNKEMMELYRRNKVNPMGGCLPMVVQIPIFIAFYQMLNEAIELKGAAFWWIKDLAEPDKLISFPFTLPILGSHFNILPILMLGSMIWQQKLTPQTASSPEQAQMMTFMPLVMGFLFYGMPSGLVLYWFVNNMLSIIQQTIVKRMVVVLHHEDQ